MRQSVWEIGHSMTTLDWPDDIASPAEGCQRLHYQEEYTIGTPGVSPWVTVYQYPQPTRDDVFRYLILVQMQGGYEIIVAKDIQRFVGGLNALAPLLDSITKNTM